MPTLVDGIFTLSGMEARYRGNTDLHLGGGNDQSTHAIITIHGTDRDAYSYYDYMVNAASTESSDAAIIAPQFLLEEDLDEHLLDKNTTLFWSASDWKTGHLSDSNFNNTRLSSYAVLEQMIEALKSIMPNLDALSLFGHGAGAQVMARFASGNSVDMTGIQTRYIVANPSHYMYFNNKRYQQDSCLTEHVVPVTTCQYDNYQYGLQNLNTYMGTVGGTELYNRHPTRDVVYAIGELDNNPSDPSLSTSCEAMWQGVERFQRNEEYFKHIQDEFGSGTHQRVVVKGIGHSGQGMTESPEIRHYTFFKGGDYAPTSTTASVYYERGAYSSAWGDD